MQVHCLVRETVTEQVPFLDIVFAGSIFFMRLQ